jgi:hypothetical protein
MMSVVERDTEPSLLRKYLDRQGFLSRMGSHRFIRYPKGETARGMPFEKPGLGVTARMLVSIYLV